MDRAGRGPVIRLAPFAFLALVSCSTAPSPSPASAEQSLVLARLPDDAGQAAIMDAVQERLQKHPEWAAKVASHGKGATGVYALTFNGACREEAALVTEVETTARLFGATETSCVSASSFAPGEPVEFRR